MCCEKRWEQWWVLHCRQIEGFSNEGIPQLLVPSSLSLNLWRENATRTVTLGKTQTQGIWGWMLSKTLWGTSSKKPPLSNAKELRGWFLQLPLHFQGLNGAFMVLLQELIKYGNILLQVVFSLFQFSFLFLCYFLQLLNLFSLNCYGILKWTQKITQSRWLVDTKGALVWLCSWLPSCLILVGRG